MFARLAPLEAKLAELGARDPQAALAGIEARLEALRDRLGSVEDGAGAVAAVSAELARLHARKDAGVEAVFARLAPVEAKLAEVEKSLAERDPRALLDRFAERLEAVQGRVAALEGVENPFGEIADQLTRLYGQKDAAVETVFARLAPLEARLGEMEKGLAERDPRALLDRFAERLEGVQGRLAAIEDAENPFAEISGQLTRLYAQKDATVETVFARLAPLEAKLAEIDARDPGAALAGIEARLGALRDRLGKLESGEGAFGEIAGQLTRLHAQKDAAVEAVFARLAPLEARLAEIEHGVERGMERLGPLEARLAERDPRAALEALRERLEALQRSQAETAAALAALQAADGGALGEVADQLTRLYAQKDAGITALLARLAPLEARLAVVEARPSWDPAAEAARDEAQGVAVRLIAGLAAAEQTALFAERLTRIEANLPASLPGAGGKGGRATELDSIWALPRVVSLHQA